jgi:hypothetical protein
MVALNSIVLDYYLYLSISPKAEGVVRLLGLGTGKGDRKTVTDG